MLRDFISLWVTTQEAVIEPNWFHDCKAKVATMESLKKQAIDSIAMLPDDTDIDEIMYRLYIIDKLRKSREAIEQNQTISHEDLKREIEQW